MYVGPSKGQVFRRPNTSTMSGLPLKAPSGREAMGFKGQHIPCFESMLFISPCFFVLFWLIQETPHWSGGLNNRDFRFSLPSKKYVHYLLLKIPLKQFVCFVFDIS